jgi:hypothetical protein
VSGYRERLAGGVDQPEVPSLAWVGEDLQVKSEVGRDAHAYTSVREGDRREPADQTRASAGRPVIHAPAREGRGGVLFSLLRLCNYVS